MVDEPSAQPRKKRKMTPHTVESVCACPRHEVFTQTYTKVPRKYKDGRCARFAQREAVKQRYICLDCGAKIKPNLWNRCPTHARAHFRSNHMTMKVCPTCGKDYVPSDESPNECLVCFLRAEATARYAPFFAPGGWSNPDYVQGEVLIAPSELDSVLRVPADPD